MNLFFHNPALISLAPLIAIPVLVHFLARAKPPQYLFSATAFVMKVVRQTIRIKRPKDRLLLLCRTLLVVSLCLVFLRPVVFSNGSILDRDLATNVVIVIDRSGSMAWSEGGRSRFAAARDAAAAVLDRLSSRDKANIVWIDREPDAVFPEMGSNLDYLRKRLLNAHCTNEYGNAEGAIRLAVSQLEGSEGRRELVIISDFQLLQWQNIGTDAGESIGENVALMVPEDIIVSTLAPVREAADNGGVLSITTDPVAPLVGDLASVMVDIGNFSSLPRNRTVIVKLGEHIVTRQVQIPAWSHGAVAVEHVFSAPGQIMVSARLDEDSFGADDWRAKMVPVRQGFRVGVMGADPRTAPVFRRALHALPWVVATELDIQGAKNIQNSEQNQNLDLVVLGGWNGDNGEELARLRQQGTPLLISPAPGLSVAALEELLGRPASSVGATFRLASLEETMGLVVGDGKHEAFTLFREGRFGDPSQAAFSQRWIATMLPDNGNMLLSYADRGPAVIEYGAVAPLVLWLTPLSPECGNWAAQPAFLPFFGELVESLTDQRATSLPVALLPETAVTGEVLFFPSSLESSALVDDPQLFDQAGNTWPVIRIDSAEQGPRLMSEPISSPGIYRLCFGQRCRPGRIVNFPGVESDLRTGQPPAIAKRGRQAAKTVDELNADREGSPLWPYFVWAALALIGLECLLVLLLDRQEKIMAGETL